MKDLMIKINSFFNRVLRYFVFSTLVSFVVCFAMITINLFMGIRVSLGFYMLIFTLFDLALSILICVYNSHKLFIPINKKLIKKLNREEVERAREINRRKSKRSNSKVS
ncbi:hypothetical protein [Peptostreptococcus canis]|uniref:Uncharacterized protein n=1 Tax=Peptostreptococcus canis TaxID=1159213 RepID=A0ABR6TK35_9FIRM|nr:hypothetical protein [Peptostreptococcus canis]MBC2575765.1 hypothetical protein [Peptostreptococcus canis]